MSKAPYPVVDKALNDRYEEYRIKRRESRWSQEAADLYQKDVEAIFARHGWTEEEFDNEYCVRLYGSAGYEPADDVTVDAAEQDEAVRVAVREVLSDFYQNACGTIGVLEALCGELGARRHPEYVKGYRDALSAISLQLNALYKAHQ